ncbi:hypothetical protein BV898_16332 [Hypsibius exemplaris]|uniref:Secreted protein n=1 Tax=Hypsibius exemplaris TaxID=2072580 RepID=A0A9X6NCZ3_HYPEX|nr:hypothetical protein BV898_16332 [Hypsibius exemplaris]
MHYQLASVVAAIRLLSMLLLIFFHGNLGQVPPSRMWSTVSSSTDNKMTARQRRLRFMLELGLNFGVPPFAVNANRMTTGDYRSEVYLPGPEEFQQLRLARRKFGFGLGKRTLRVVRLS